VWIIFIWLRTGAVEDSCEHGNEPSGFMTEGIFLCEISGSHGGEYEDESNVVSNDTTRHYVPEGSYLLDSS
jgi:hypothetical protein